MRSGAQTYVQYASVSMHVVGVFGVIAIVGTAGSWFIRHQPTRDQHRAFLSVAPEHLDLGVVWEQGDLEVTIPITNDSEQDTAIHSLGSTCGCTSITPSRLSIAAGATQEVRLNLDLFSQTELAASLEDWDFSVDLFANTAQTRHTWTVTARVQKPLVVTPPVVFVGETLHHGCTFPSRTVQVLSRNPLDQLICDVDAEFADVSVKRIDEQSRSFTVNITLNESLPCGDFGDSLSLRGRLYDGTELPAVPLRVVGTVVGDLHAIPPQINLIGADPQHSVAIQSRNGTAFQVEKVTMMHFSANAASRQKTATLHVVTFQDVTGVTRDAAVKIDVRNVNDERHSIIVPIRRVRTARLEVRQ